ncbi:MAG: MtnX-like HAD-IB family phosphatase [Candidatus Latescibacterota bacterium]|nr:MAG: MtnX-like HAD-IB family phosphatase [Candidatus Latescibacterota bacterium]
MKKIAILCDFDGTVAREDVGSLLFQTFADAKKSRSVVKQWKEGLISSKECLEREAEMARVSRETLDHFICRRKLDPYFKDFVDFAKRRGMEIVIVSDGLDYYIEKMLIRTGLADLDFFANNLHLNEHALHVKFPYYDMLDCRSCGNCKTYHMEKYKADGYFVVYIGNGLSDRCPSEYADYVFAKGELLSYCRENGVEFTAFRNFRDVERELLQHFVLREEFTEGSDDSDDS